MPYPIPYAPVDNQPAAQKAVIAASNKNPVLGVPLPSVADIFKGLNLGSLALRVTEILLGIVLIGVGLAKLTGAENVISRAASSGAIGAAVA